MKTTSLNYHNGDQTSNGAVDIPATNLADKINALHRGTVGSLRRTVDDAIEIGRLLTAQKDKLEHGEWLPWLKENIEFDDRSARNYARCYKGRAKLENVSNLNEAYKLLKEPKPRPEPKPIIQAAIEPTPASEPIQVTPAPVREVEAEVVEPAEPKYVQAVLNCLLNSIHCASRRVFVDLLIQAATESLNEKSPQRSIRPIETTRTDHHRAGKSAPAAPTQTHEPTKHNEAGHLCSDKVSNRANIGSA